MIQMRRIVQSALIAGLSLVAGSDAPLPARQVSLDGLSAREIHRFLQIRAGFDLARFTDENRRHWQNATSASADADANRAARAVLRDRSRYETANNAHAKGMVKTLADDTVGTGPRIQLTTDSDELNAWVEREFGKWCTAIGLADKLRTMRKAKAVDGEAFAVVRNNPRLLTRVKADLRVIECDRVTQPYTGWPNPLDVDGIRFDEAGNPVSYTIMRRHPGAELYAGTAVDSDTVRAESVIHYFTVDRAEQSRGVPELTPALGLFATLRRYTMAALRAAETAAEIAAVMETNAPGYSDEEAAAAVNPYDTFDLERGAVMTLPEGWKLSQLRSEQPTTTYAMFRDKILNEIARCLNMPFNIAVGNSSGYNYASGRLDHQTYYKSIGIEQSIIEGTILDRLLRAWLDEAVLITGYMPTALRARIARDDLPDHTWFWDGREHVDPVKEASAQEIRLRNHTTTLAAEYARSGKDWETEIAQRAKEQARLKELGLTVAQAAPQAAPPDDEDDDAEPAEREEARRAA